MWWSSFQTALACFLSKRGWFPVEWQNFRWHKLAFCQISRPAPSLQKIHPFYPSIFCKWASKPLLCKKIFRFSLLFFANELQNPLFAKILRLVPHCANLVPFPPASPNLSPAKKGLWKTEMIFHSPFLFYSAAETELNRMFGMMGAAVNDHCCSCREVPW